MFGMVFPAFVRTSLTGLGAERALPLRIGASHAHQLGGSVAQGGTLHIELNAPGHHADIFFPGTGTGAMVTDSGALKTGVNAGFPFMISHNKMI